MATSDTSELALRREMTRVAGALYLSGGVLVLAAVVASGDEMSSAAGTAVVAAVAGLTGLLLWVVGERVAVPPAVHTVSSALGSVVVALIVVLGGEATAGLFGIFYVYVAAFSFYYFPLPWAVGEVVLAGLAYGAALAMLDFDGRLGAWLVAMGATVTAGALIGSLGHRQRDLANREAERAAALAAYDSARATLLRIVSHDLRGPLSTIAMSAQTLIDEGERLEPEVTVELLRAQRRQAERLLRLVSDVLDTERLQEGTLRPNWQNVELRKLVEDVVRGSSTDPARIEISGHAWVRADPVFIERALENVLANGLRHTAGSEPITVAITPGTAHVDIVVDDRGPGVPDEEKLTIFEPFVSHDPDQRSPGLGLSVTRALIRAHGGDARVEDRPGGGARFVLSLPIDGATPDR